MLELVVIAIVNIAGGWVCVCVYVCLFVSKSGCILSAICVPSLLLLCFFFFQIFLFDKLETKRARKEEY